MAAHVLEDAQRRTDDGESVGDDGPQVTLVGGAATLACRRERLARVARADDVDLADPLAPVDRRHVAQIGDVRVAVREDLARAGVDVGHGDGLRAERTLQGDVDAAVASAEAHVPQRAHVDACLAWHGAFGVEVAGHDSPSSSSSHHTPSGSAAALCRASGRSCA